MSAHWPQNEDPHHSGGATPGHHQCARVLGPKLQLHALRACDQEHLPAHAEDNGLWGLPPLGSGPRRASTVLQGGSCRLMFMIVDVCSPSPLVYEIAAVYPEISEACSILVHHVASQL